MIRILLMIGGARWKAGFGAFMLLLDLLDHAHSFGLF